jgi:uncharacterized protein YcfL
MLAVHFIEEGFDMNVKKIALIAMVFALGVPVTGCTSDASKVENTASFGSKVEHHGTAKYLAISGLNSKISDDLLTIHAEVTNTDGGDQQGFYRVRWLDESGDPVWNDEAWKPLLLHGNQKLILQIVAPTIKARDFKMEFSAKENWRD